MRTRMIAVAVAGVMLLAGVTLTAEDKGESMWFETENCYFHKPLGATPGLLQNMEWETFPVANGILSVTTVKPGYEASYAKAHDAMVDLQKAYDPAKPQPMCGMCKAFVSAMDRTLKMEDFKMKHGYATLTTSTNPQTVAKLHTFVERNNKEMAEWEKSKNVTAKY